MRSREITQIEFGKSKDKSLLINPFEQSSLRIARKTPKIGRRMNPLFTITKAPHRAFQTHLRCSTTVGFLNHCLLRRPFKGRDVSYELPYTGMSLCRHVYSQVFTATLIQRDRRSESYTGKCSRQNTSKYYQKTTLQQETTFPLIMSRSERSGDGHSVSTVLIK